ncbi:hypothetical protein H3H36_10840 [Duganella sp. FT3S]|uniref:Uncharacterized protein n=1 Tax=Rugamonas fusca TaxID=2758568 RepID=A0A7W2I6V7_9BURK|nr:hypothetical protein [Rugamonas fusca]MBA5605856.1 hypothetical protein [Rugamonas fusca]
MKLSKEQKQELTDKLSMPWGSVELLCDGRRVSLQVRRFKQMTYRVMTYVDGVFKGAWCMAEPAVPEHKFMRKLVRPNLSPAKRKEAEKRLGKRYVAKDPYFSGSVTVYLPDWSSGKTAINHLCKVCESVEVAPTDELGSSALDIDSPQQKQVLNALELD